jgi:uncharacterized SAM-binding protein YcdF (DUF218 family)
MSRPRSATRTSRPQGAPEQERTGVLRRLFSGLGASLRYGFASLFTVAFALLVALVWFGSTMPDAPADTATATDAIVVLTGGEKRLEAGVDLLRQQKAPRLYVSGVNQRLEKGELLKQAGNPPPDLAARIEFDVRAGSTAGNAKETARWFNSHNLKSMRLVTANYHMRRSVLQFERELPRARLIRHPVVPPHLGPGEWWSNRIGIETVAREFVKYVATLLGFASD